MQALRTCSHMKKQQNKEKAVAMEPDQASIHRQQVQGRPHNVQWKQQVQGKPHHVQWQQQVQGRPSNIQLQLQGQGGTLLMHK